jgi:flagellar biosynthetic protein FliP
MRQDFLISQRSRQLAGGLLMGHTTTALAVGVKVTEAFKAATKPLQEFMLKYTREKDLALFVSLMTKEKPKSKDEITLIHIIPAFVISELKTSFQIGFMIYLPFLVIDIVVASVLLAMGMLVLPPAIISLPFKLMLFVLVDGWNLIIGSLVKSFEVMS